MRKADHGGVSHVATLSKGQAELKQAQIHQPARESVPFSLHDRAGLILARPWLTWCAPAGMMPNK